MFCFLQNWSFFEMSDDIGDNCTADSLHYRWRYGSMKLAPSPFFSDSVHKYANVLSFSFDSAWIGCSIGTSSNNPLNRSNRNDVHDFSALIECWISVCTVDIYGRMRALYSCAEGTRKSIWIRTNKLHKFDFWANAFDSHGQSANESCWTFDHTLNRRKCLAELK